MLHSYNNVPEQSKLTGLNKTDLLVYRKVIERGNDKQTSWKINKYKKTYYREII